MSIISLTAFFLVDSFLRSNSPQPALHSPKPAGISRTASPALSVNGRKSPYQMPSRSATSPLPAPVPSPDLSLSQDCAFPLFPTSKSRSATPTTPSESSFPFSNRGKPPEQMRNDIMHAPLSPRRTGGGGVMQKMDSIAPGPFNLGDRSSGQPSGHRKSPSMNNSQDFVRPTSSGSSKSHYRRPSTSSSNYTRNPSISSTAGSSRFTFERSKTDVPAVPTVPQQQEIRRQEGSNNARNKHQLTDSGFDFGSFGQENRSQTFPKDGQRGDESEDQGSFHRRPSEPSVRSHKPRPSVAAAVMQPLHEIGSTSSFKPSKSTRGRNAASPEDQSALSSSRSIGEAKDDKKLERAPPVLINTNMQSFESGNTSHTPHESTSSNESYSSGPKTGSSRSTPPLSDSPQRLMAHSEDDPTNNMFNGFHFDVERRPSFEEPAKNPDNPSTGYLKPRPSKPSATARPTIPTLSSYDEPPQRNDGTVTSPEDYVISSFASHSDNLRLSPAQLAPPPVRGAPSQPPRTANKGNCRGCGEIIKGKSVSSADGRLTGRYHKQCFVCKTCQAPFQTADFYVMHNHPYCGRHYHELNNSLCQNCDRGIEGQYLQTEKKSKFHPHCFSCQECHRLLRDDYFEWNGRTLCEQHAFQATQQPSSLGPGRRFPERRTTRLMMM